MYYCEVCFALPLAGSAGPLPQSFTYTYRPQPWQAPLPKKSAAARKKAPPPTMPAVATPDPSPPLVYPETGQRVFAGLGRGRKEGWIISASPKPPESLERAVAAGKLQLSGLKELEIIEPNPLFGPTELGLARWLAQYYMCSLGEALNCILPTGKKEKEPLLGESPVEKSHATGVRLSAEQSAAIATVCGEHDGKPPFYYLFGPTGSGKTEVFLHCMAHALAQGKSVIYLVPEISLCYQLQEELQNRFRQPVAVLHSHLSAATRLGYWRNLQQGKCRIVLGARSAVFAPIRELGLIVLDEEHEASYKAGDTPRYHARQVAMRRCRDQGAVLLMGSATPSVEAMNAYNGTSRIEMLRLSKRLAGGSFPKVEIVDLRSSKTVISEALVHEIEAVTSQGDQAILFLNRRGYSPIVECFSCGKVQECRNCSVALAYHKNLKRLKCHQCGFSMPMIYSCNYCHQSQLEFVGFGTEQIEEELQRYFGHLRIARLDTDVSRKKGQSQKILRDFRSGEMDVLVGTQMVAKGLNFERVKLVGVILADTSLNMPDFRASERSFSLLVQVAGRAGRYRKDSKVLIQTYQPQNAVVQFAAGLDWQGFYARETDMRRLTRYPPFSRIIRLVFRGSNAGKTKAEADLWFRQLREALAQDSKEGVELLPPCECPYFRVAEKYRFHMLLRSGSSHFHTVHRCVRAYFSVAKRPAGVYVEIDVDPTSMM
ncbi:MAG: primosomal protein N' [Spirochaetota bacterium]